jgi:hypothetical protein
MLEDVIEEGHALALFHLLYLAMEESAFLFHLYAHRSLREVVGLRVEQRVSVVRRYLWCWARETPRVEYACADRAEFLLIAVAVCYVEGDEHGIFPGFLLTGTVVAC